MRLHFNRNAIATLHDAIMAAASFLCALYLRLGDDLMSMMGDYLAFATVLAMLCCVTIFTWMRLYRGLWRYASMQDLLNILRAGTLALLVFYPTLFFFTRLEGMPRTAPIIHWFLLMAFLSGPRFLYRSLKDRTLRLDMRLPADEKIPVLIIGVEGSAEYFLRESLRNPLSSYRVVAVVDENPKLAGSAMHGVRIYPGGDVLPKIIDKLERKGKKPQRLLISSEYTDPETLKKLVAFSDELGIPLARLPNPNEFRNGIGEKASIRPIDVEDLLGRPQNLHNRDKVRAFIQQRRILITGAGGSIGSELVRQIASYDPAQITLVDVSEYQLYLIDRELQQLAPELPRTALLCDVRDERHIDAIFAKERPQLVFHAAAIKHVPIAEDNPEEAILTNCFGTKYIADACQRHGVEAMLLISTDKAVNPTNVMGAAKRLAEQYCQAAVKNPANTTRFVTVRFGNVLGSTGSVVPLFEKQLAAGGPLTVTDPEMTRFFMTIREAVDLVLQAATLAEVRAEQSAVFVLDMGKPVKINDLALQMIRLAGLRPHQDIEIRYTGLRPGEKLYEELFYISENVTKTQHQSIMLAHPPQISPEKLAQGLKLLFEACVSRDAKQAVRELQKLVADFQPDARHHA